MTPQSLLPDSWILATGLFYWLPGEIITSKIWKISPPSFGRSWPLLLLTPSLLTVYSFLQSNSGMVHEGRLLLKLSFTCAIGAFTYVVTSGQTTLSRARDGASGLKLYSCILFAYYVWFLTLLWWLPAGVRSIWIWPLQFEPRLITGITIIVAISLSQLSTIVRLSINKRLWVAALGCLFWQLSGILGKSLSIDEIAISEKITGYLGASRLFTGTSEVAKTYVDKIGALPFHVNTHPAGKVFLMKVLDDLSSAYSPRLWALLIVLSVCLVVPLAFKISRLLLIDKSSSALIATSVSILPSITLFCPGFDAYNAFLCTLLLLTWLKGLVNIESRRSLFVWACIIGALGYVVFTFSYTGLVFGTVLIGWSPWIVSNHTKMGSWRAAFTRVISLAFVSLGILALIDGFLYISTGYSNLSALIQSINVQHAIEAQNRSGFNAFILDFTDFAYGISPILFSVLLVVSGKAIISFLGRDRSRKEKNKAFKSQLRDIESLVVLNFASLIGVAISGFLDIETSRVWIILMVPVSICVASWVVKHYSIDAYRSVLFCEGVWGATLLLRYQFLF